MRWFWGISLLLILIVIDLPDCSCDCTCEVSLGHNLLRYYLVKSELRSAIWSWTRDKTNYLAEVVTSTTNISAISTISAISPPTTNNDFNLTTILIRKATNVSMDLVDYILNTGLCLINWTFETSGFSAPFVLNTYIEASYSVPLITYLKATAIYWNIEVGIFRPVPTRCFPSLKSQIDGNVSLCLPCGCIAGVGFTVNFVVDKTLPDEPWLASDIGAYSVNSATRFPYTFVRSAVVDIGVFSQKKTNFHGKIIDIRIYFQQFSNADVSVLSDVVQSFSSINITSSIFVKYAVRKWGVLQYVGALTSYDNSIYSTSGNSSNGSIFSAIDAVKASMNKKSLSTVDIYKLPINPDSETLNVNSTEELKTSLFPTSSSPSSFSVVSETSIEVSLATGNINPSSFTTLNLVSIATPPPDSTNPVPDISSTTPFDNLPTIPSLSVISGTQDVLISYLEKNVTPSDASRSIVEGNTPSVDSVSVTKSDIGVTRESPIAGQIESKTPFNGATSMENAFFNLNNTTTESLLFKSSLSTSFLSSVKGPSSNNTTPRSVILNTSFTTVSTDDTTATANKLNNVSTYDPDPFFKPEVPVIKKTYNDEWLLRKTIGTMPPITTNSLLLSITIPAFVSVMVLASCCLILLSSDCPTKKAPTFEKNVFAQP